MKDQTRRDTLSGATLSGNWAQGTAARAQCASCGSWVLDGTVWRYWVGPVARLTVCATCAEAK